MALLPRTMQKDNQPNIQIQFFTKKKQFKVFLEFQNSDTASKFFSKAFGMKKIQVLNEKFEDAGAREMRVYLVKTEEEFQQLALKKYQAEIKINNLNQGSQNSKQD